MFRNSVIEHVREVVEIDGVERDVELEVELTAPEPETYWEPRYPGDIIERALTIDGRPVELGAYRLLVDALKNQIQPRY